MECTAVKKCDAGLTIRLAPLSAYSSSGMPCVAPASTVALLHLTMEVPGVPPLPGAS